MAIVEDPATVLEIFVHDVANLPAEIAHLYEEMQAKDQQIIECRSIIASKDNSIQKFIRLNGGLVKNPKEEPYSKLITQNYDRAQILQEEKIGLCEKAASLLDRHIKRLDLKLRDLQSEGSLPSDPSLPSLLRDSPGNIVPPALSATTGSSTPLLPLSGNTAGGGSTNIANAAIARIANAAANGRLNSSSIMAMQPHPLLTTALAGAASQSGTPTSAIGRHHREMSVSSDTKRRRLNASLGALPTPTSSLARQQSAGPGTPKPGTPVSRAGSVGPRPTKKATIMKRGGPVQQALRKKLTKNGLQKKARRSLMGGASNRASPSTTADEESALSDGDGSDEENGSTAGGHEGEGAEEAMEVDDEGDDTKYCVCQRVSYGDMIACDNENCKYQWFHWECVGMKKEPDGDWLCPECSKLDKKLIKKAR